MEGQEQKGSAMDTVAMAFNMGVSARRQSGDKSVVHVANELGQFIYSNLSQSFGGKYPEEFLLANTEHLLQIALLGYIIPEVCAYDEGFKTRLFNLIEAKINQSQAKSDEPQGGNIITP